MGKTSRIMVFIVLAFLVCSSIPSSAAIPIQEHEFNQDFVEDMGDGQALQVAPLDNFLQLDNGEQRIPFHDVKREVTGRRQAALDAEAEAAAAEAEEPEDGGEDDGKA